MENPRIASEIAHVPARLTRALPLAKGIVRSLRPHQWVKNALVLSGVVFSKSLFDPQTLLQAIGAFCCFCAASSGVYLMNDLRDMAEDQLHPVKRKRPIAAGIISPLLGSSLMLLLLIGSQLAAMFISPLLGVVLGCYMLLNIAYSMGLKRMVILDVMAIALGFVLRAIAGAVAIGVPASAWLLLCTLLLALLVGFGKRRHELTLLSNDAGQHRVSLESYSPAFLDAMMMMSGSAAMVCYALYTMADETVQRFGSRALVFTMPWVLYGIFRYFFLIHQRTEGGDPAKLFLTDKPMLINGMMWVMAVCVILYGPMLWAGVSAHSWN